MTNIVSSLSALAKTTAIAAATFGLAGLAFAGSLTTISADLNYNAADLATNPAKVLSSLETQAIDECSYTQPLFGKIKTDEACVAEMVRIAVEKIDHAELSALHLASQS